MVMNLSSFPIPEGPGSVSGASNLPAGFTDTTGNAASPQLVSLGILVVIGGILCLLAPSVTGAGLAIAVGIALAFAAGSSAVSIFKPNRASAARVSAALLTMVLIVLASLMLLDPWEAAVSLSALLAVYLFASSARWLIGALTRREQRVFRLFGAAVALAGGVAIAIGWPLSGEWAIGVFAAVELIAVGVTMIASGRDIEA